MSRGRSSLLTKEEIAQSLEACLKEKPLDKITIIDITDGSGVSRQMFYHYFSDRSDLIRFVCRKYICEPLYIDKMFFWENNILDMLQSRRVYADYYKNILHSRYQKLLREVINNELYSLFYCVIRYRICRPMPNELEQMLKDYCVTSADIICAWLDSDAGETEMQIRLRLKEAMPMQVRVLVTERSIPYEEIFRERKLLNWAYEG